MVVVANCIEAPYNLEQSIGPIDFSLDQLMY